jgi:hypothetical protein
MDAKAYLFHLHETGIDCETDVEALVRRTDGRYKHISIPYAYDYSDPYDGYSDYEQVRYDIRVPLQDQDGYVELMLETYPGLESVIELHGAEYVEGGLQLRDDFKARHPLGS